MPKHFCCCLSLKTGAFVMAFLNALEGAGEIISAIVVLSKTKEEGTITLFIVCLLLGFLSAASSLLLITAIIQAKEKYVLMYLLLSSVALMVVIIYTGINMFVDKLNLLLFLLSVFMCYGQLYIYHFYEEVAEYNTVSAGVIEIAYNGDAKSYVNSSVPVDGSVDNTAV